jgi:opacity protein-like surface antigen
MHSAHIHQKDGIMRHMKTLLAIGIPVLLLAGLTTPALAQNYRYQYAYPADRPVQFFIDGGASITAGDAASDFDNGFTIGGGVNINPQPGVPLGLRFELNYARFSATNAFLNANEAATGTPIDDGSMQTVTGFADLVLRTPINPWVHVYALGGVGLGYRRIELTQNGFFCDAFFCGPGGAHDVIASNDVTKFAWNAGAGIDFALPGGQSWFVEARYERIETQSPTEFIPIRVGWRF